MLVFDSWPPTPGEVRLSEATVEKIGVGGSGFSDMVLGKAMGDLLLSNVQNPDHVVPIVDELISQTSVIPTGTQWFISALKRGSQYPPEGKVEKQA